MKLLYFIFINSSFLITLILWQFYDIIWARNIFVFLFIVSSISIILGFLIEDARLAANKEGRSVNKYIAYIFDMIILFILFGTSNFFLGIIWTVVVICEMSIFDSNDKSESTKENQLT